MKKRKPSPKKGYQEKRKTQRLNIPIQIKYKLLPQEKILEETFCQNISGGGIGLNLDTPLKKGDKLKTFLHFPDDRRPVIAKSKVIWCKKKFKKGEKPCFDIGIQHMRIEPKDKTRFVFLFCEMMINYFILSHQKITLRQG